MGNRIPQEVLTAYHEAGHAVAARDLQLSFPRFVTIVRFGERLGHCQSDDLFWRTPDALRARLAHVPHSVDANRRLSKRPIMTRKEWRAEFRSSTEQHVVSDLAGYAAEWRRQRFSRVTAAYILALALDGAGDDIMRADAQLQVFEPDMEERRLWLGALWDRTWTLTGRSWGDIKAVAAALLKHKTLDGESLARLLLPPADPKELRRTQRSNRQLGLSPVE